MRIILILLLMTFSGCQSFPTIEPQERCVISLEFDKCRCHEYDLMEDRRVSESYDETVEYCERMVGFRPDSWEDIKIWLGEIKLWKDSKRRRQ